MSPYAIAVLFTLASTALYALGYALAKLLAETLHPFEITFLRSALVLGSVLALTMVKPAPLATITRIALPARPWAQRMTGAMLIFSTTLGVIGYWLVPITEAAALGFTAPVILAALGAVWLKEEVTARRWIAVLLGFAGMLVVVRPGGELFTWYATIPIASALSYATYQVMARRIRDVANAEDITTQGALMGVVLLAPAMLVLWRSPDLLTWGLVVIYTLLQTAALLFLGGAVRRAEVSALAPWQYARIAFALALD
ncbi:MAG: DMT family transporter, partial [Roseomonas sp.]|nr:DMT family transporter [Roseomonas sp.]